MVAARMGRQRKGSTAWAVRHGLGFALASLLCATGALAAPGCRVPAGPPLAGVNIAGGEFGSARPGRLAFDYAYPSQAEIDYFAAAGFRVLRVPFLGDRAVSLDGTAATLRPDDIAELDRVVDGARKRGLYVVLDLHEFGELNGRSIGKDLAATQAFATIWQVLAKHYARRPNVIFGLMNEPHLQTPEEWLLGANAGIRAIRAAGARQLILVPGSAWTGAHSWIGSRNGAVMTGIADPQNHFAIEVHQYLDGNSSGSSPEVIAGAGTERLAAFTDWARRNGLKAFLGEFGWPDSPAGHAEGESMLRSMAANGDVWLGFAYWAAGPMWGDYMFSVEPADGRDKPQMAVLKKYAVKRPKAGRGFDLNLGCK